MAKHAQIDVDAVERLCTAATDGPWEDHHVCVREPNTGCMVVEGNRQSDKYAADVAFVTKARSLLPELCAEIRRLDEIVERLMSHRCLNKAQRECLYQSVYLTDIDPLL